MGHNQTPSFLFNHRVRLQHGSVYIPWTSRMNHEVHLGECLLQCLAHLRSPSPRMTDHPRAGPGTPVDPVVMISFEFQISPGHHKLIQYLHAEPVLRWSKARVVRLSRTLSVERAYIIHQNPKFTWIIFRRRGGSWVVPRTTSMKAKLVGGGCRTSIRRQLASLRLYAMILSGF